MTGGEGAAGPGGSHGRQWDVVLSFAGAQRDYVEQVARALQGQGVRCFYDADEEIGLWGKHLAEELPAIYGEQAAAVVVFISAEYAARDWTRLERQAALARAVRERREYVLPARFDDAKLPGLLPDVVTVDLRRYAPAEFAGLVAAKLADLGIGASAAGGTGRSPAGAVRVRQADPRRLGVHAAISVPGVSDDELPEYVPRDADTAGFGVRARVAAAAERGGFVLLVGGSSVGKTRCAAEAVRALLPDWWLVHPGGPGEVAALAAVPPGRTVVWLDELQRYLDGEHGLAGGVIRALLGAPGPVLIIATLWPDRYHAYTAVPVSGGLDPHAREREVLGLAAVVRIGEEFSPAEQGRARVAAARDRRLALALGAAGYGLTQILAAAPQLVACWQDARAADPYGWAVLTAALDVARLGGRAPLTADLLREAAPGYCTSAQQAEAPPNWFERVLAYATEKLHGAAAALAPVAAGMGQVAGYIVADYLLQHASRERRPARVPASTWDALLRHLRDPADAARLGRSAQGRLLYRYATPLYRRAADAGDRAAAMRLAELLAMRGDMDEAVQILRNRADPGDEDADDETVEHLADLLADCGDLDGLRTLAEVGYWYAAWRLTDLMARRGDLNGLRARADAGDGTAARRLADLLADCGDLDQLHARADAGDGAAARRLAGLLADRGDLDEAEQLLRDQADADDWYAARRLADLLADRGDLDQLRARADAGDGAAARRLAGLLADRGDLDEAEQLLRDQADAGDRDSGVRLAGLLADRGDLDEAEQLLRDLVGAGDGDADNWDAAWRLADLLARRGDLDGLRARGDAGDWYAAVRLAELLADRGDLDQLRARADAGDGAAARRLAELLADRGDLDQLRARADAGDGAAARRLAELLADRGDLDQLRARADAGDGAAARRLAELLADRGDLDEAEQLLRNLAGAGDGDAYWLAGLLVQRSQGEEAERLRRFGLNPVGSIARGYQTSRPVTLPRSPLHGARLCPRILPIRDNDPLPLIARRAIDTGLAADHPTGSPQRAVAQGCRRRK